MTNPPSLVVLDGHTLNPGDLCWKPLEAMGHLTVYDRTPASQIIERAVNASLVFTNKTPLTAETIDSLPRLKYIGVLATGYNVVDVGAARQNKITVTNVPNYATDSVAQHTIGLMLELARNVRSHAAAVHGGEWSSSPDFCFTTSSIRELTGKMLGIVGFGRIGSAVARIAQAMNMHVVAAKRSGEVSVDTNHADITRVSMDDLFARSDIISLHCPLNAETDRVVNRKRLSQMQSSSLLINTSRGGLIDSQALADALREGTIAGAALDVLDKEPPPADHPLVSAPNCLVTPHVAWCAIETRQRLMATAVDNVRAFLAGRPQNVINA